MRRALAIISLCACLASDAEAWIHGLETCGGGGFLVAGVTDCNNVLTTDENDPLVPQ